MNAWEDDEEKCCSCFWHFYIFFNSGMNHLIFLSFPLLSGRSCQSWSMIHILTSFFQPKSLLASNPTLLVKLQGGVCARYQIPSITAVGRLLWCFWREEELCACVSVCVCGCEPLRACMHVCACVHGCVCMSVRGFASPHCVEILSDSLSPGQTHSVRARQPLLCATLCWLQFRI